MSYIIIAKDAEERMGEALSLCKKSNINELDITRLTLKDEASSIGIKDVKEMMKKIFLKPLRSKDKAVIIEDADLLTTQAQSALLKVLEEPPAHTIIILVAENLEVFLPTILSRCLIIVGEGNKNDLSSQDKLEFTNIFYQLLDLEPALALELAEKFSKNKNEAPETIKKLLITGRKLLLDSINTNAKEQSAYAKILKKLQDCHKNLTTTNINTRLQLEHLLLSLITDY